MSRQVKKGQNRKNRKWVNEQKRRRDNLEGEFFSSLPITPSHAGLFTGKQTRYNAAGIDHNKLRS